MQGVVREVALRTARVAQGHALRATICKSHSARVEQTVTAIDLRDYPALGVRIPKLARGIRAADWAPVPGATPETSMSNRATAVASPVVPPVTKCKWPAASRVCVGSAW